MLLVERQPFYAAGENVKVVKSWVTMETQEIPVANQREFIPSWAMMVNDKCMGTCSDDVAEVIGLLQRALEMYESGECVVEVFHLKNGIQSLERYLVDNPDAHRQG